MAFHCTECEQHEFADSDKGRVTCPQCRTAYIVLIDKITGETTVRNLSGNEAETVERWKAKESPPKGYVTYHPDEIKDPNLRAMLCGPDDLILAQMKEARDANPHSLTCTFCGEGVDPVRATYGKKPKTVYRDKIEENPETGEVNLVREKLHRQDEVVACPSCSLNIRPSCASEPCPQCAGTMQVKGDPCTRCHNAKTGKSTGRVEGAPRTNNRWYSSEDL